MQEEVILIGPYQGQSQRYLPAINNLVEPVCQSDITPIAAIILSRLTLPSTVCDIIASTNGLIKRTEAWNEDWDRVFEIEIQGYPSLVNNASILHSDVESGGCQLELGEKPLPVNKVVVSSSETKGPAI